MLYGVGSTGCVCCMAWVVLTVYAVWCMPAVWCVCCMLCVYTTAVYGCMVWVCRLAWPGLHSQHWQLSPPPPQPDVSSSNEASQEPNDFVSSVCWKVGCSVTSAPCLHPPPPPPPPQGEDVVLAANSQGHIKVGPPYAGMPCQLTLTLSLSYIMPSPSHV